MRGRRVVTGTLALDLLLGDVHSLKEKRTALRPIVADLRRHFPVSAAEVGWQDLHRRAVVGVAVVGSTHGFVRDVLDGCERSVAAHPEVTLLSARRRVHTDTDEEE